MRAALGSEGDGAPATAHRPRPQPGYAKATAFRDFTAPARLRPFAKATTQGFGRMCHIAGFTQRCMFGRLFATA